MTMHRRYIHDTQRYKTSECTEYNGRNTFKLHGRYNQTGHRSVREGRGDRLPRVHGARAGRRAFKTMRVVAALVPAPGVLRDTDVAPTYSLSAELGGKTAALQPWCSAAAPSTVAACVAR